MSVLGRNVDRTPAPRRVDRDARYVMFPEKKIETVNRFRKQYRRTITGLGLSVNRLAVRDTEIALGRGP